MQARQKDAQKQLSQNWHVLPQKHATVANNKTKNKSCRKYALHKHGPLTSAHVGNDIPSRPLAEKPSVVFSANAHHECVTLVLLFRRVMRQQIIWILQARHLEDIQLPPIHFLLRPQLFDREVFQFTGAATPTNTHRGRGICEKTQLDGRASAMANLVSQSEARPRTSLAR